jgi:hypothetical protein
VIKGKWVILGVLAVAVLMTVAAWPLVKIRMNRDLRGTQKLVDRLNAACHAYRARHGEFPSSLDLVTSDRREPRDAWSRPIKYAIFQQRRHGIEVEIIDVRSQGPNSDDSADDIRPR